MMLAFYLAAPEVENDRRSLNIFHGTQRAKKEGRWVATAPVGYANLTGSASQGQAGAYYYYYHCSAVCKVRFKAGLVNASFPKEVNQVTIRNGYEPFYVDSLLLSGKFTGTDFQSVKSKCEKEIVSLESKLPDIIRNARIADQLLDRGISNFKKLSDIYKDNVLEVKRKIISSMYPKNLVFDGFKHRTIRINEIIENIFLINSALGVKNWTSSELSDLSSEVGDKRETLNRFMNDLRLLIDLRKNHSNDSG